MPPPKGQVRLHPSRRHRNPDFTKNEKPRIFGMSRRALEDLIEKSQRNKEKAKYRREIARRFS